MTSDVWAAVPVKEFAGAKQRLSPLLTVEQRRALAAAMLAVPGDIPRATAAEIAAVVAARRPAPSLTIVPAHDGRGSNAVLCSPPLVMPLRFGDDSFLPHLASARALGIEPTIVKLPGIGLDIDQPDDALALLRATPPMTTRAFSAIASSVAAERFR